MTDNRTTELRRKLTELGESYSTIDGKHKNTVWYVGELTWWYDEDTETGKTVLFTPKWYNVTPEQAIAATLGSGTCEVQHVKSGAMYDVWRYTCCGYEHAESVSEEAIPQNFCPKCGAKAVMQ